MLICTAICAQICRTRCHFKMHSNTLFQKAKSNYCVIDRPNIAVTRVKRVEIKDSQWFIGQNLTDKRSFNTTPIKTFA